MTKRADKNLQKGLGLKDQSLYFLLPSSFGDKIRLIDN